MQGDIIMGDGLSYFGQNLTVAVREGQVSEERASIPNSKGISRFFCF